MVVPPNDADSSTPGKPRYKHGPDGPRTALEKGERPVTGEERRALLNRIVEGLDDLLASGAIDRKDRDRRRRAAKQALGASCLWHCPGCDIVYGRGDCPGCGHSFGDLIKVDSPEWRARCAKWDYNPAIFRRLAARLGADLLRVDGPAKAAPAREAPRAPSPDAGEAFDRFFIEGVGAAAGEAAADGPTEEESLARREELIAIWKRPEWARAIVPAEREWRLSELEKAIRLLFDRKVITEEDRDRRIEVARAALQTPDLTLCGCGYCHSEEDCPVCGGPTLDAVHDAEAHAAPSGRASSSSSPAIYQMVLAALWWDLTRDDDIPPRACQKPPKRRPKRSSEPPDTFTFGAAEDGSVEPMGDFPPEPLPLWEPTAAQRGAARGLTILTASSSRGPTGRDTDTFGR